MNTILIKIWNFLKQKNNMLIAIIVAVFLFLVITVYFQNKKIQGLKDKYQTEVKLKDALLDTVHTYINKHGELVAEKLTIQETIKNLDKMYGQLTVNQQELISRVKEINKKNDIIAAALYQSNVRIDSLLSKNKPIIDTINNKITFTEKNDTNINYNFEVRNVIPSMKNIEPSLLIKDLSLLNKSFVEFHWDKKAKTDYPVSFSISNSNKYIKATNIDSYAIPAINKNKINPSGWQKFGTWILKNGKYILICGAGFAGGIYLVK